MTTTFEPQTNNPYDEAVIDYGTITVIGGSLVTPEVDQAAREIAEQFRLTLTGDKNAREPQRAFQINDPLRPHVRALHTAFVYHVGLPPLPETPEDLKNGDVEIVLKAVGGFVTRQVIAVDTLSDGTGDPNGLLFVSYWAQHKAKGAERAKTNFLTTQRYAVPN